MTNLVIDRHGSGFQYKYAVARNTIAIVAAVLLSGASSPSYNCSVLCTAHLPPPLPLHADCWGIQPVETCAGHVTLPVHAGPCTVDSECAPCFDGMTAMVLVCMDVGYASIPVDYTATCAKFPPLGCINGECYCSSTPSAVWSTASYWPRNDQNPDCQRSTPCVPNEEAP